MARVRQSIPKVVSAVGFGSTLQVTGVMDGQGTLTFVGALAPMPIAGTARNLAVYAGYSRGSNVSVAIYKNGVSTSLAVTLTPSDSFGSNTSVDVTYDAGDVLYYVIATPFEVNPGKELGMCVELEGAQMVCGIAAISGTYNPGDAMYGGALGNGIFESAAGNPYSNSYSLCGINGKIRRLTLRRMTTAYSGGSWIGHLILNGVVQDGTGGTVDTSCVLLDANTFETSTFTLPFAPWDKVDVLITRAGTTASFAIEHVGCGISATPDIAGQWMLCGGNNEVIPNAGTTWKWNDSRQEGADEYMHTAPFGLRTFHARALYIERSLPAGGGKSFAHTVSRNGIESGLSVLLSGASAVTGVDTGRETFQAEDLITLTIDNVGSPDPNSRLHWVLAIGDQAVIGPLAWWHRRKRLTDGTTVTTVHSDQDMQCPGPWYEGFKEAVVMDFGDAERALSDPVTGDWTGSTFRLKQSDTNRTLLEELASQANRYWVGNNPVYMTTRENRAVLGTAYCVFNGPIVDAQPDDLSFDIILGDVISRQLQSDQGQVPWRQHKDGFLSQLIEISESLDREAPEPIGYGEHRRVPDVDPASPQGFIYTPPLLGKIEVAGDAWWVWEAFGHAIADITDAYVIEQMPGSPSAIGSILADEGTKWLIPHHPGYLAQFGAPYEDRRSDTYGNERRYTLIYGKVGEPDPDACADGTKVLAIAFEGIEPIGDGSGQVIIDRFEQRKHFDINFQAHFGADSYQSGAWLTNPVWDFPEGPLDIIETDSYDDCSAIAKERLPVVPGSPQLYPAGYIGAAIIGGHAGDRQSIAHWDAEWNKSLGCRSGFNHFGQKRVVLLHPTQEIKDAAPLLTDVHEILKDSFKTPIATDQQANRIPFMADFEHATGRWMTTDVANADSSIVNYDRVILGETRQYLFAPGIQQSYHLALMAVRESAHAPRSIVLEGTIGPDANGDSLGYFDLGDYIRYRHFASISDSAGSIRLAMVTKHQVQAGQRKVRIEALDCDDLIDFDAPSIATGGSPGELHETCATAFDLGDLSSAFEGTFDTSDNATDLSVSGGSPPFGGSGIAYHAFWFTFATIFDGVCTFSSIGSEYDTQIAAFSGSCGALVPQGFNDNFGVLKTAVLDVDIVGGTDYFILVAGYGPDDGGLMKMFASFTPNP